MHLFDLCYFFSEKLKGKTIKYCFRTIEDLTPDDNDPNIYYVKSEDVLSDFFCKLKVKLDTIEVNWTGIRPTSDRLEAQEFFEMHSNKFKRINKPNASSSSTSSLRITG